MAALLQAGPRHAAVAAAAAAAAHACVPLSPACLTSSSRSACWRRAHSSRQQRIAAEQQQAPWRPRTSRQQSAVAAAAQQHNQQDEAGTVWGSALLIAGTTVGAGILALPAVTQEAGFVPAAVTLTGCCAFSIITGLLLAEVHINLLRTSGASSVPLTVMAARTLGAGGAAAATVAYVMLSYALLVAYVSKGGELVAGATGLPPLPATAAFAVAFAGLCFTASQRTLDLLNGGLVAAVVASFAGLLAVAGGGVDADVLLQHANWAAVPATLPVCALAFVYHNVMGVVVMSLKADVGKVRSAVCAGVAIPYLMFLLWEGAILGSLDTLALQLDGAVSLQGAPLAATAATAAPRAMAAQSLPAAPAIAVAAAEQQAPQQAPAPAAGRVADPLAALAASSPVVDPLVCAFSFFAIATSYLGFVLGLGEFLGDALRTDRRAPAVFALVVAPPVALAAANPGIFISALDAAGAYGVLSLFGLMPAAMAWRERYGGGGDAAEVTARGTERVVPGGKPVIIGVAAVAGGIILNELLELLMPH